MKESCLAPMQKPGACERPCQFWRKGRPAGAAAAAGAGLAAPQSTTWTRWPPRWQRLHRTWAAKLQSPCLGSLPTGPANIKRRSAKGCIPTMWSTIFQIFEILKYWNTISLSKGQGRTAPLLYCCTAQIDRRVSQHHSIAPRRSYPVIIF